MTVTEFCVVKGAGAALTPAFRMALDNALAAQTKCLKSDLAASGLHAVTGDRAWLFQQIEDPATALVATTWADVDQHNSCAASATETYPTPPITLVHAEGDLLDRMATPAGKRALLDSPVISLTRMFVQPGKRDEFEAAYNTNKIYIEEYTAPNWVRGGWRVDKEGPGKDEFVLVTGWATRETHFAIAETENVSKLEAFTNLLYDKESLHYKRLL